MKHWPLLLVATGTIFGGLVYATLRAEVPDGLREFRCQRLPAPEEATYPPFWTAPDAQLFDVDAPVETVVEGLKKTSSVTLRNGFYESVGPDGTLYLFAGAVWSYEDDPRIPAPPTPSPKGRTIVLTRSSPSLSGRLRMGMKSLRERLFGADSARPLRIGYLGDIDAKTELTGV